MSSSSDTSVTPNPTPRATTKRPRKLSPNTVFLAACLHNNPGNFNGPYFEKKYMFPGITNRAPNEEKKSQFEEDMGYDADDDANGDEHDYVGAGILRERKRKLGKIRSAKLAAKSVKHDAKRRKFVAKLSKFIR
ncbi:hypothetical protein KEM56_001156 [Ascosphaera pollenicola]|nr:hypothetical protein KEM56_001156 [Ascosphaera pollenicola]